MAVPHRWKWLTVWLLGAVLGQSAQAVQGPQRDYMLQCMGCHLEDGSGKPERGIPNMAGVLGHFLRLPEGRALIVQVPGVMNTPLDDRQVADLMNWLLAGMAGTSRPADAQLYTADEVKALRANRPADVPKARAEVVRRLRAMGYAIE